MLLRFDSPQFLEQKLLLSKGTNKMPKYPNIKVKLTGRDGNAFVLLGAMKSALYRGKVPQTEINTFLKEAMSGDYDHLLATCTEWADVS